MSLLYLVHKNIVLKFSEAIKAPFHPEASYAFRLTGVDAMGFLQIQELGVVGESYEPAGEAFWINKDLVRELHELELVKDKTSVTFPGKISAPVVPQTAPASVDTLVRDGAPKASKTKLPKKSVLKQKPVFN